MTDFKPGDIVRCLRSHGNRFTKGNLYTVKEHSLGWVSIASDDVGEFNGIREEFFELASRARQPCIVAINGRAGYSPAPKPFVHENFELASKEAKRLAEANPGNEFAVYERVKGYRAEKPTAKEVA